MFKRLWKKAVNGIRNFRYGLRLLTPKMVREAIMEQVCAAPRFLVFGMLHIILVPLEIALAVILLVFFLPYLAFHGLDKLLDKLDPNR